MRQGAMKKSSLLKRDMKDLEAMGIEGHKEQFEKYRSFIESMDEATVNDLLKWSRIFLNDQLSYDMLTREEKVEADRAAKHIQVCIAMVAFVVVCFVTEAIPLPGVAFCVGLILVFQASCRGRRSPSYSGPTPAGSSWEVSCSQQLS